MSLLPCWAASSAASKSMSSICSSRPSLSAMAPAISTSMPSNAPVSVVISYGGKAALVDMVSLPGLTVVSSAVSVVSEEDALPPQAARLSAMTAPSSNAVIFFINVPSNPFFIYSLLLNKDKIQYSRINIQSQCINTIFSISHARHHHKAEFLCNLRRSSIAVATMAARLMRSERRQYHSPVQRTVTVPCQPAGSSTVR